MDFELTAEQLQVKFSVREFANTEIAPHVLEWDETQHFPVELLPHLAELGLMRVIFQYVTEKRRLTVACSLISRRDFDLQFIERT